jgi:hypothetical protein
LAATGADLGVACFGNLVFSGNGLAFAGKPFGAAFFGLAAGAALLAALVTAFVTGRLT